MKKEIDKKMISSNYLDSNTCSSCRYESINAHECFMSKEGIRLRREQNKPLPSFVKKFHGKQTFSEDEKTKIINKFCIRLVTRAKILSRHFKSTINEHGMLIVGPISIHGRTNRYNNFKICVNKLFFDRVKEILI